MPALAGQTVDNSSRKERPHPAPRTWPSSAPVAGGTALMEIFANDPLVQIVGVAEIDDPAPGIGLAKRLNIPSHARLPACCCNRNAST